MQHHSWVRCYTTEVIGFDEREWTENFSRAIGSGFANTVSFFAMKWNVPLLLVLVWASIVGYSFGATKKQEQKKTYWLTAEADAPVGRGTEKEPWRVSTAKEFDRRMSKMPPGVLICLGLGVFHTTGRIGFLLKTGQSVIGAGIGKTTIRLVTPDATTPLSVVVESAGDATCNIVLQDLTVDCNYSTGWGNITLQGVNLQGSGHRISRVEVLRSAGFASECFALGIYASTISSSDNVIDGCLVREHQGGWCTSIFLVNNSCLNNPENPMAVFTSGIVRNNVVDLRGASLPAGGGCAYGGGGIANSTFMANVSKGANFGFNFDTTRIENVTIEKNQFASCRFIGINFRAHRTGDRIRNIVIANNVISLHPEERQPSAFGIVAGGDWQGAAEGCTIEGNRFTIVGNSTNTQITGVQLFGWTQEVMLSNNQFAGSFKQDLEKGAIYKLQNNQPEFSLPSVSP